MPGRGKRFRTRQDGVSPVVGTVLILVIMILAIGGIMAWGVPAITGLQQHAEYQAVVTQFLELESQARNLRAPESTKRALLSLAEGKITFNEGSRWVVTAVRDSNVEGLRLSGWETGNPLTVSVDGIAIDAAYEITVDDVDGGTFTTKFNCPAACPAVTSLGGALLSSDVVRVQVKGATVLGESWIFNMGRISYRLTERNDQNQLHYEMGAVFSQQNEAFFIEQAPTLKDPDYTISPQDTALALRIFQLTGTQPQTVSGQGRFPVTFHLVDNYGSSRGRPAFDPARVVRLQIHGDLEAAFCNYFDKRAGWVQVDDAGAAIACPDTGTADFVNLRYDRGANPMIFDMIHSVVTTTVRTL